MITPGSVNPLLLTSADNNTTPCGGSIPTPSYVIKNSLRFRRSATAVLYLASTQSGSSTAHTNSFWVKRGALGAYQILTSAGNTGGNDPSLGFTADDKLRFVGPSGSPFEVVTTQVFRDPSAWYHIVTVYDTANATASERARVYINGVKCTSFSPNSPPSQGQPTSWGALGHYIHVGASTTIAGLNFDGYMADFHYIDGQALDANAFGEFDLNGVWRPKAYSGTYPNNSFWLKFEDSAQIGKDSSGNNNHRTPQNIDTAAPGTQATYDLMKDSPVMFDDGTPNPPGNYATLNPISGAPSSTVGTLRDGNLKYDSSRNGAGQETRVATIGGFTSGKYYFETTLINLGGAADPCFGVAYNFNAASDNIDQNGANVFYAKWDANSGNFTAASNGTGTNLNLAGRAAGKVVSVAVDFDANKIWWAVDGVWGNGGVPATGASPHLTLTANQLYSIVIRGSGHVGTSTELAANFGQRPFQYPVPNSFKSLCSTNLPMPSITNGKQHFDIALGAGAGILAQAQALTPHDLIWIKDRANSNNHQLIDVVRGANALHSNDGNAEIVYVPPTGNSVAWAWKAGGAPVANNDGTIASRVSVNKCAGFSIVKYTGNGTGGATVGHGLGVKPTFQMIKRVNSGGEWLVRSDFLQNYNHYLVLNRTSPEAADGTVGGDPTASTLNIGTHLMCNTAGGDYIAYCFAPIPGMSAFGKYVGNGNPDGTFVYTGFKPRFILIKRISSGQDGAGRSDWCIYDTSRMASNAASGTMVLCPEQVGAEGVNTGANETMDVFSNGFKLRGYSWVTNDTNVSYIYIAFAEHPFKISLAR